MHSSSITTVLMHAMPGMYTNLQGQSSTPAQLGTTMATRGAAVNAVTHIQIKSCHPPFSHGQTIFCSIIHDFKTVGALNLYSYDKAKEKYSVDKS